MNRKYELKERARRQAQTRQRIVEAAVELHTSVGPARTTISGIAERAGVERHTVYAHFPDDRALFRACSEHWAARHPMPDLETLAEIDDPVRRLRRALGEMYSWYESVEADLALFVRDASVVPANAEALDEMTADFAILADAISQGLATPEERQSGDRARVGVRDVALARPPAGPFADAGGRRDGASRLERLAQESIHTSPSGTTPRLKLATCSGLKGGRESCSLRWNAQNRCTM